MKIAITGTRGIPNHYGGFEQFAMMLSKKLVAAGYTIIIYLPHRHPCKDNTYNGVNIIRKWLPEKWLGSGSHYLFDLFSMRDAIQTKVDVILECGYASAAPWYPFLRWGKIKLVTHMDGMEWQRKKWNGFIRKIIRSTEAKAVRHSDAFVCDHPALGEYYRANYSVDPEIITYGAEISSDWDETEISDAGLKSGSYYLLVARLEPENNIRMIIEGFLASGVGEPLVLIGDHSGRHGRLIFKEFGSNRSLRFLGGMYNSKLLDNLRHFSKAVFHGHSVGGTNPSLLEAMAAEAYIIAHDNVYNRWVLGENANYFKSAQDITELISGSIDMKCSREIFTTNNLKRIREDFQWDDVVKKYEELFQKLIS